MKRQAKSALDQAGKSYGLMRQVSVLEDKVSGLVAQVMHLKECDSYLVEIIESACKPLKYEFFCIPSRISCCFSWLCILMNLHLPGSFLHPTDEDHWVSERIAALERVSRDRNSLWANPRHHSAVVLLQDRAHHIGEAVDGCQRSLTTMYFVMLPHNPPLESFKQLLDAFRSS
jgi:hypothetical protein